MKYLLMEYQLSVMDIDTFTRRLCNTLALKGVPSLLTSVSCLLPPDF